jgi:hypothetical protein
MEVSPIACACALLAAAILALSPSPSIAAATSTFVQAGDRATATLLESYYAGRGYWRICNQPSCSQANSDWGVDSALYALYLRWRATSDPHIRTIASELLAAGPKYPAPCDGPACPAWSDTPAWDAVAFMREYEILGRSVGALARAQASYRYATESRAFAGGACAAIPYQQPRQAGRPVKTLETDANLIKAALLLYDATHDGRYLEQARVRYANDRLTFLDTSAALYTVHVLDDGAVCVQQPRRYFASINGDMIWNGIALWRITGQAHYYAEAIGTAHAVDNALSDGRDVFVDLGGANDVVEPLVEAMSDLASNEKLAFAQDWIVRNAAAALSARAPDGTFSRFFDGPPQRTSSIWESNGGLALEIEAAALDPDAVAVAGNDWKDARLLGSALTALPATVTFEGSGVALLGTIGSSSVAAHPQVFVDGLETSDQMAHLRVFVDGRETFDQTGLWQNHDMPPGNSVRFAWRWPIAGRHTIRLEAANAEALGPNVAQLESMIVAQ